MDSNYIDTAFFRTFDIRSPGRQKRQTQLRKGRRWAVGGVRLSVIRAGDPVIAWRYVQGQCRLSMLLSFVARRYGLGCEGPLGIVSSGGTDVQKYVPQMVYGHAHDAI